MTCDVRKGVSSTVTDLEKSVKTSRPSDRKGIVRVRVGGGHPIGVHQPVVFRVALIKNHLPSLVKDLSAVMRRLIGLTCAIVNEQVSTDDHEVIVNISGTTVQGTTDAACAVHEVNVNTGEGDNTCAPVDAFQSDPFGWGLIGLLRVAVDSTGVDE